MKKIAIITRTKDRPVLLQRAFKSISQQTFNDYVWVIINDGGAAEPVDRIVDLAKAEGIDAQVHHFTDNQGMESASNYGIKNSKSNYLVIHDDDDTWNESFLKETVTFLDGNDDSNVKAVITHSVKVKELLSASGVKELNRLPYNCNVSHVTFLDIAALKNNPPPISIVFERGLVDEIGYFDESLPVLGDWDFLIRYLMKYQFGLIPKPLAYYHIRERVIETAYSNSIIAGKASHKYWERYVINKYLQRDIDAGIHGVGFALMQISKFEEIRYQISPVRVVNNLRVSVTTFFRTLYYSVLRFF